MKVSFIARLAFSLACAALAVCCTPNIPTTSNDYKVDAQGGELTISYTASSNWSVVQPDTWYEVSPKSGKPGAVKLTVSVPANTTPAERSSSFFIVDGATNSVFNITQACPTAVFVEKEQYRVPMEGGEISIPVKVTGEFTVSTDADWISCPSTKAAEAQDRVLVFGIAPNTTGESRYGTVVFSVSGVETKVVFFQGLSFYKAVLGAKFTGVWCGYCPLMSASVEMVDEKLPGRLNCISFYNSTGAGQLSSPRESDFRTYYGIGSESPLMVLDERVSFSNIGSTVNENYTAISAFISEMIKDYDAVTGISMSVALKGEELEIVPMVRAAQAGDYYLNVLILENGVVQKQEDYLGVYSAQQQANFVHNHIVRGYATPALAGEAFHLGADEKKEFPITIAVPSTVSDPKNISIAAYVTRAVVDGPKAVAKVTYLKDRKLFVDNSVICPVNSSIDLRYEE